MLTTSLTTADVSQAMDVESIRETELPPANKKLKQLLLMINCLLLSLGSTGGPLITRLYFLHGGHRQWLSSLLETAGFPIVIVPLSISYLTRLRGDTTAKPILITLPIFLACAVLGFLSGVDSFLYTCGLSFLPVSTSAILLSTQLAFTAFFAFVIVKQKFTPYSLNSVALLTVGAVMLGMNTSSERPKGVSKRQHLAGFVMSLGAAALYGLFLPLIQLTYQKAKQEITYTLVMEMQFVMGAFASLFCVVGMVVNNDLEAIPKEASRFGLGEVDYYVILVTSAVLWQFFSLGVVGVVFCGNTLLAGIIIVVFIPVTEALGVVFYREKFGSEKGVALALSLWGLASYSYGEYLEGKKKVKKNDIDAGISLDQTAI